LREKVLRQTTSVIRTRRRWKRAGLAAVLVCCYAAGMGTVSVWRSGTTAAMVEQRADESAAPMAPSDRPEGIPKSHGRAQVAGDKLTPYDRLRQTGDRQLEEQNDIAAAVRTYRRALQAATADERAVSVDHDSWLLLAVKSDQSLSSAEQMP
jgi:hypothetical protein